MPAVPPVPSVSPPVDPPVDGSPPVDSQPGAFGSWAQGPAVGKVSVVDAVVVVSVPAVVESVAVAPVLPHSAPSGSWAQGPAVGNVSVVAAEPAVSPPPSSPQPMGATQSAAACTRTGTSGRGVNRQVMAWILTDTVGDVDGPAATEQGRPGKLAALRRWLFAPEDAAGLAVFRFLLGVILAWDAVRFIVSGWAYNMFLKPEVLFKYWGFEWVHPLPPVLHHAVFYVLVLCGIGIALGWWYRLCATLFFLGHAYIYLLAASHYLNHAYLICLLTLLIIALPMDRALSLRAKRDPSSAWYSMPRWPRAAIIGHVGVVYVYGGIAKINTDWLVYHMPVKRWMANSAQNAPFGKSIILADWFSPMIAYGGCLFDLLIFPALLWRKSRPIAILLSAGFHLTNAFLFNIGVFPWLMLAITTLFFDPSWPRRLPYFGPRIASFIDRGKEHTLPAPQRRRALTVALACWFAIQILMPLRHHLYPSNVAWSEEAHLYSWRMKLRSKRGRVRFRVEDKATGRVWVVKPQDHLTKFQKRKLGGRPELMLQFAHYLAEKYRRDEGLDVAVYCDARVSLNYRPKQVLIDPTVDLTQKRMHLAPYDWILPFDPVPPPKD